MKETRIMKADINSSPQPMEIAMNIFRRVCKYFETVRKPVRKAAINGFKPWLETLEERITPVDRTWVGGFSGNIWSDGRNWGGVAPQPGDIAIIPSGTCDITSNVSVAGLRIGAAGQAGNATVGKMVTLYVK